jgi:CDP-diacylglycerol pyrophosphatase
MVSTQECPQHVRRCDVQSDLLFGVAAKCKADLKLADNGLCQVYNPPKASSFEGSVIVKDYDIKEKPQGFLLIPVACIPGIEDDRVSSQPFVDLWEDAWVGSRKYPGKPESWTGLAINSQCGRGHDQLHIHISCVTKKIRDELKDNNEAIPLYPSDDAKAKRVVVKPVFGGKYTAVRLSGLNGPSSPFKLANEIKGMSDGEMANHSLAIIGSQTPGEYYLLNKTAYRAHAEELLDQKCEDFEKSK